MDLIKRRNAKTSDRGIYLQDKELLQTVFTPGTNYKYIMDVKNRKLIILSSVDSCDNTVSKRATKEGMLKPVLDIRCKETLSAFKGCEYLQVSIYEEQVIVEGFIEEALIKATKGETKELYSKTGTITDIRNLLKVKQIASAVLSKTELRKVVGASIEQLSFDLFTEVDTSGVKTAKVIEIQSAIEHLSIPLKITSLFSASGIFDAAFEAEGFEICFALEKEIDACRTYEYNFKKKVTQTDINDFDLDRIKKSPIMIAGSPCQGLSNSNRYTNFLDNPNNLLIKKFIEAVLANDNCKIWVIENVPQLLTAGNGKFANEIKEALREFEVVSDVLCAADFGSAQLRERAIMIGSKVGKVTLPSPTHMPHQYKTVREAFTGLHSSIPNQCDISKHEETTMELIRHIPPGGNIKNIPEGIRPKGVHSNQYKRLKWDEPAITIVNPRKAMILHPEEDRILSVRECGRLFGVPDTFSFLGSLSSKQQMIANAVPMELGKAIARVIKSAIKNWNIKWRQVAPV